MKKKRHIAYESVLFIHFVNVGGFAVRWLTHTVKDHRSHLCAAAPPTRRLINCHFKRMEEGVVDELFSLITSPSMTRSLVFKIRLNCSQLLRKRATVFWGMTLRVCNERLSFFFIIYHAQEKASTKNSPNVQSSETKNECVIAAGTAWNVFFSEECKKILHKMCFKQICNTDF